jgi:hypothetical protein
MGWWVKTVPLEMRLTPRGWLGVRRAITMIIAYSAILSRIATWCFARSNIAPTLTCGYELPFHSKRVDCDSNARRNEFIEIPLASLELNRIPPHKPSREPAHPPRPEVIQPKRLIPFTSCVGVAIIDRRAREDGARAIEDGWLAIGCVGVAFRYGA